MGREQQNQLLLLLLFLLSPDEGAVPQTTKSLTQINKIPHAAA